MASVQHLGPFIGLNLAPRATHAWSLGPLPKLFDTTAEVSAHPWPLAAGSTGAEIAVTSVRSQVANSGERFLVFTVENTGPAHLDGYNVRATLTSLGGRAGGAG